MVNDATIAIVAIVAAVGLLGLVLVETSSIQQAQQAFAAQPPGRGCEFTPGGNASKGRCIHP
jgi:preprotein translocase subunit SecG